MGYDWKKGSQLEKEITIGKKLVILGKVGHKFSKCDSFFQALPIFPSETPAFSKCDSFFQV